MTARPVVFISLEPWDQVWRRNQHLLTRLRATGVVGDVLYVEPSVDPMHAARLRRRPRRGRGLRPLAGHPGITVLEPTKLLPRRLHPGQDARWARRIIAASRRVGLADPLLWVNDPRGAEVLMMSGWPAIYDITDDWLLAERPESELQRLRFWEEQLLADCKEVIVCSPALAESKSARRSVTLIPNGVDLELYERDHPRPADLPDGRVVLYAGTLHSDRLDVELCCATARSIRSQNAFLVLVGPDALTAGEDSRLDAAGVIRLGARRAELVPAYLQHADVLVVPHLVTRFTQSLDPIKAYEYAAARRPVVSTPVAGFRERSAVLTAQAPHFVDGVRATLCGDCDGHATKPTAPTWQRRAEEVAGVLRQL